jgi:hypothetical protein
VSGVDESKIALSDRPAFGGKKYAHTGRRTLTLVRVGLIFAGQWETLVRTRASGAAESPIALAVLVEAHFSLQRAARSASQLIPSNHSSIPLSVHDYTVTSPTHSAAF